ncbi:hypothetical protein GPALN_004232 [Globodera pallida]|nr:hypothetical protein GPALN_004232 [Globodera pallida]
MTLTLTPMTPMTPFLSGVMTYDADAVIGILLTLTLTPMTPMTPFLSGVMTYDADAVTGLSKKMTLTRDADSGTGDVQPWSALVTETESHRKRLHDVRVDDSCAI